MGQARGLRRLFVVFVALLAMSTMACFGAGKKKVKAPETTSFADEPPTKWESAGETMPPDKKPDPPKPPPAPPAAAVASTPAGQPPGTTKRAAAAPAPATVSPASSTTKTTAANGARPPVAGVRGAEKPAAAPGKAPAATRAPSGPLPPDTTLLAQPVTFESENAPPAPPKSMLRPSDPLPPKESPRESSRESREASRESDRDRDRDRERDRDRDRDSREASSSDSSSERPRSKGRDAARAKRGNPIESYSYERRGSYGGPAGDIRGVIGGDSITFKRGMLLGNWRHGYSLQIFDDSGSNRRAEINLRIDADLEKRRIMPVSVIYLAVPDDGPRSMEGVREHECEGKGELVVNSMPALPRKLPRDDLELGDIEGTLNVRVVCVRGSRELGAFTLDGRLSARLQLLAPDL